MYDIWEWIARAKNIKATWTREAKNVIYHIGGTGAISDDFGKKRCNFLLNQDIDSFFTALDSPSIFSITGNKKKN